MILSSRHKCKLRLNSKIRPFFLLFFLCCCLECLPFSMGAWFCILFSCHLIFSFLSPLDVLMLVCMVWNLVFFFFSAFTSNFSHHNFLKELVFIHLFFFPFTLFHILLSMFSLLTVLSSSFSLFGYFSFFLFLHNKTTEFNDVANFLIKTNALVSFVLVPIFFSSLFLCNFHAIKKTEKASYVVKKSHLLFAAIAHKKASSQSVFKTVVFTMNNEHASLKMKYFSLFTIKKHNFPLR